ncbi:cryptochrome-1-like isoform X2 [Sipha flava]|nr:cryptochrome-1-like isoform X2 [Sipha flava]
MWGTTNFTFEEDPEPFGRVRDQNIKVMCREMGISVITHCTHTLYKLDKIININGGKAPMTYNLFHKLLECIEPPEEPVPTIDEDFLGGAVTPIEYDHNDIFGVPTLEELGFIEPNNLIRQNIWKGGETEALVRLQCHLERKEFIATYGKPQMTSHSLLASPTGLAPYLRFGCLSTRLFFSKLNNLYQKIRKTRPPLSLHGQLLWRDFFYCASHNNPNFDRILGNPICLQIPWDKNPLALSKWANGQTGYPLIDAIMIQLRHEGWIHSIARYVTACFLTWADLWLSWEEGMKVFDELLLDADWSVNAGSWMRYSCSSFFQDFTHSYNCPVKFGRKIDPNGDFIRRYIPALKNMPTQYTHEPWLAPESVQIAANCIIGIDYPLPIINHELASKINFERMKLAYQELSFGQPRLENGKMIILGSPRRSTPRMPCLAPQK